MRNILRGILILVLAMSTLFCVAAFAEERIEISFSVGDDIICVNNESVKVEKPYVVGEGVTLVPLRFISEAFGADVVWNGEDMSITIDYEGVNILLQIANTIAEVNGKVEMLQAPPEISPMGLTMVPLRFIAETFGAIVSYNEETKAISIVKGDKEEGSTVEGAIVEKKIGDSKYGWSMENPTDMTMDDRSGDGSYTSFSREMDGFGIEIFENDNFDINKEFYQYLNLFEGCILVKADKDTENNRIHIQARSNEIFGNIIVIANDKYVGELIGVVSNENKEQRDEFLRIMSTFEMKYDNADTYDLVKIVDGRLEIKDEEMGFEFSVPEDYVKVSQEGIGNEIVLNKDNNKSTSLIVVNIFSKLPGMSAASVAQNDYDFHKTTMNPELATFSDNAYEKTYAGIPCYEYSCKIENSEFSDCAVKDVFFEKGEYIYNVYLKFDKNESEEEFDKILGSIKVEEIDAEKMETVLRWYDGDNDNYKTGDGNWSITVPGEFVENVQMEDYARYYSVKNDCSFIVSVIDAPGALHMDVKEELKKRETQERELGKVEIISPMKDTIIKGTKYTDVTITTKSENLKSYIRYRAFTDGKKIYVLEAEMYETNYCDYYNNMFDEFAESLKIEE